MRDEMLKVYDLLNARDGSGLRAHVRDIYASDAEIVEPGAEHGLDDAVVGWVGMLDASEDLRFDIVSAIETETHVVLEVIARGTHTGPLGQGDDHLPATGRPFLVRIAQVTEYEDGQVRRWRSYWDRLTLLTQLGAAPSGEAASRPS
jgi:ketosteroid isomerase-like protein